jgi:beta-lactamase class A
VGKRIVTSLVVLLLIAGIFLAFEFARYRAYLGSIRPGITAGGVDLGGMTPDVALRTVEEMVVAPLSKPLHLRYEEETVLLIPADVGFRVHGEKMVEEALRLSHEQQAVPGLVEFVMQGPRWLEAEIPLQTEFDTNALRSFLMGVAERKDQPLREVQPITGTLSFYPGQAEKRLNPDLSIARIEEALLSIDSRGADLVVETKEPPKPSLDLLRGMVEDRIQEFDGIVGVYISDPGTQESMEINSKISFSGMSVVKIAIFLETYLHFSGEEPDLETKEWMDKVVTDPVGSNYWANLLLSLVGEGSATEGARKTTEMMRALGLNRSFIKGPFRLETEEVEGRRRSGLASSLGRISAKERSQDTNPDPMIQTSPQDMGRLLEMIYRCGYGGGAILDTFPGMITPQGCQEIQEILAQNPVRSMIGAGIPEGTPLAHKHGFAEDTHADAGIVYSPGGDYVIVQFQYAPIEWLVWALSQPVFEDVSRATYNFFNLDQPYLP